MLLLLLQQSRTTLDFFSTETSSKRNYGNYWVRRIESQRTLSQHWKQKQKLAVRKSGRGEKEIMDPLLQRSLWSGVVVEAMRTVSVREFARLPFLLFLHTFLHENRAKLRA